MPQPKLPAYAPIERVSDLIQHAEPYHQPGILWRSSARPYVNITSGSLNIICCEGRDEVLGYSLKLAQEIATTEFREANPWPYNPEDVVKNPTVLYINTSSTRNDIQNELMGLWPGAQEWSVKRDRYLRENPAKEANLFTYHVPCGEISEHFAEIALQRTKRMASVVILNSFEFAARTARHRDDLVFQLMKLRAEGCTVIVFTQEVKRKVEKQARGPLALLRMQSNALLDKSIFTKLEHAAPVGSTHANEEEYYASTGENSRAYFDRVRAMCGAPPASNEQSENNEDVPMLRADEIEDSIRDDIDLPRELVDGGVYTFDGELVCVNSEVAQQTMNQYNVHLNAYQPSNRALSSPSSLSQPSPFKEEGALMNAASRVSEF